MSSRIWCSALLLALLAVFPLQGPGQTQGGTQMQALQELVEKNPEEAIGKLNAMAQQNPSPQIFFLLARAWARVDATQSPAWLEKVFALSPRHEEAWRLWADIMTQAKQYEYAILRLERQLKQNPDFSFLPLLLAQIYVNTGDLTKAEKAFRRVIELAPQASEHTTRALFSLGYQYVSSGRFEEGKRLFREVLSRDRSYLPEVRSAAVAMMDHEQWREASQVLVDLLELDPDDPEVRHLLSRCYVKLEQWTEAIKILAELVKKKPDHLEARFLLAKASRKAGQVKEAQRHFDVFWKLNRKTHLQRFASLFKVDSERATLVEILKSISLHADPEVNIFLNDQRAERYHTQLQQQKDPRRRATLGLRLAWELLRAGRNQEAVEEGLAIRQVLRSGQLPNDAALAKAVDELLALAYLRLGEQENCLARHSADSCLLPIADGGIHSIQRGSRSAIQELSSLLYRSPDNLGYRWLLNLAHMTVGDYPGKVPDQWLIPPEVFASDYDIRRFRDIAPALGVNVSGRAGGSIMEDFDGDGHLDIMASSWGLQDQLRYFHNNGDGTFSDRTEKAGLRGQWGGLNLVHADYNNDRRPDVLVLRGGWLGFLGPHQGDHPNSLLRNNGDGTFTDMTREAGLLSFSPSQTAAWGDYDLDGWLDLFIGNESYGSEVHPCELFHNNGDGTFTEVALLLGLDEIGVVKGAGWGDYNNDGYPDLYISRFQEKNLLYRNEGPSRDGWRFTEVGDQAGVREPEVSFPTWFWDYDNDGWEDILAVSFSSYFEGTLDTVVADYLKLYKSEHSRLYRNNGDGTFTDVTREARLDAVLMAMGANFGDLDNDGFLDCYFGTGQPSPGSLVPNRMFRNSEGRYFQDVTTSGGFGHLQKGHGISFGDLDNDGDQDIYHVLGGAYSGDVFPNALFENPGHSHHWITLRLTGVKSNRFGVGARIKVNVTTEQGPRAIYATVGTGGSFGSSSLQQEIGLGQARAIRSIEIRWPTKEATVQVLTNVPLDRIIEIREGDPSCPICIKM